MKIIFFGTSNVALPVLESLSRKHEIVAVITRPDAPVGRKQEIKESPVSVLAEEMKLKTLKPEKVKGNEQLKTELASQQPDLAVVVSYGKILPQDIISLPRLGTLNVHFSMLPAYRGSSPIQFSLLNGDGKTGISIFLLDEEVDHGPLLAQYPVDIDPEDNYFSLSEKMAFLSGKVINEVVEGYAAGTLQPKPQPETGVSHTKMITAADGKIDWQKSASEIYNAFRAYYPWPGCYFFWEGKKIKINDGRPAQTADLSASQPGTVLPSGFVACGQNSALEILTLQMEGKTPVALKDFLNGYQRFLGSVLA